MKEKLACVALLVMQIPPCVWGDTNTLPASGNVGVGTLGPIYKLELAGNGTASGSAGMHFNELNVRGWLLGAGVLESGKFSLLNRGTGGTAFTVDSTDNVGIGLQSPLSRLHVRVPSQSMGISWGLAVNNPFNGAATDYGVGIKLQNSSHELGGNETNKWAGIAAVARSFWSNFTDLTFYTNDFNSTLNQTLVPTERMRIQGPNVGIGTAVPAARLHVDAGLNINDNFLVGSGSTGAGDNTYFSVSRTSAQGGSVQLDAYRSGIGGTDILLNTRMGGNVGIGTIHPTHKLSVNGTVRAKEVIVETAGWSDYVFTKDYVLAPLSEVEQHIQKEGHLPGIPSAQEVAEKGVGVGEMQAKLLAKIEELTLHVIAIEKENKLLKHRLDDIQEGSEGKYK